MCKSNAAINAVIAMMLGVAPLTYASENGQSSYPVGVNTVLNGLLPAPGQTYYYDYFLVYHAGQFNDGHGDSSVPAFRAHVIVNASRIVHTWETPIGPFTAASGVVLPLANINNAIAGNHEHDTAQGDVIVHSLFLGYTNDAHNVFGFFAPLDVLLPTGEYNKNSIANTGLNHYTWMPSWQNTWFATPNVEVSTGLTAEINAENHDTDYRSGNSATFDWMVGYSLDDKWQVGVQGFYSKQFTDDEIDGDTVLDGFRGQGSAIGPQVRYTISPGVAVALKWQHEFDVENRPEGDRVWFQFAFPL
jgi:hypothetical protein